LGKELRTRTQGGEKHSKGFEDPSCLRLKSAEEGPSTGRLPGQVGNDDNVTGNPGGGKRERFRVENKESTNSWGLRE